MFDQRRITRRTVTITTVETWTISIGPEFVTVTTEPDGSSDTVIAPIDDRVTMDDREDA